MARLALEPSSFPDTVLHDSESGEAAWWALYTKSRQEKATMRKLRAMQIAHYCPLVVRRFRQQGRVRTSCVPLFPSYVFILADELARARSWTTNSICQCHAVNDGDRLRRELLQIERLIRSEANLTPESRLEPGMTVRVKQGPFRDIEGVVVKRHNHHRLVVALHYLGNGVSLRCDDIELERLN